MHHAFQRLCLIASVLLLGACQRRDASDATQAANAALAPTQPAPSAAARPEAATAAIGH